jgi:hypothetical protein
MQQGVSSPWLTLGPLQVRILTVIYLMMLSLAQIFVSLNCERGLYKIIWKESLVKQLLPTLSRHPGIWEERHRKYRTDVTQESQCHVRHCNRVALFIVLRIFLSSTTLCNTSSFITQSVQLIFFLHQQDTSKLSRYFRSTDWKCSSFSTIQSCVQSEALC